MKKQILIIAALTTGSIASAKITVQAHLTGSTQANVAKETQYKGESCGLTGRGSKWHDLGSHNLSLDGGSQTLENGSLTWTSNISHPFQFVARTTRLDVNSVSANSSEKITLHLHDIFGYSVAPNIRKVSCDHDNGHVRVVSAELSGTLKISYQVPENIWAIQIDRSGDGYLHKSNMLPIQGALSSDIDSTSAQTAIMWVKPGSIIIQEIQIPKTISANKLVGTLNISFKPMADLSTKEQLRYDDFLKKYQSYFSNGSKKISKDTALTFINYMNAIASNTSGIRSEILKKSPSVAASLSKKLFDTANDLFPGTEFGLSIKTSAALASYEIASSLLQDLSKYCEAVDVHLPLSNKSVRTIGLRAAGFWLTRGLNTVKSYRFDEYEAFLAQLVALEKAGATYESVKKDKQMIQKIDKAWGLLTDTIDIGASPFSATLKDVNRTLKQFGSLGSTNEYAAQLLKELSELNQREQNFVLSLSKSLDLFTANSREGIRATAFAQQLQDLKAAQARIANDMEKNIQLISFQDVNDANSLFRVMTELLSNQIALFEEPIQEIPYFENIRAAYQERKNISATIKKAKACITGDIQ